MELVARMRQALGHRMAWDLAEDATRVIGGQYEQPLKHARSPRFFYSALEGVALESCFFFFSAMAR
jgi:hypothetical protein